MDPADTSSSSNRFKQIESALQWHEAAAFHQAQTLDTLAVQMQLLTTALTKLTAPVITAPSAPMPSPPRYAPELCVQTPELYAGDPENCDPFLTNCFTCSSSSQGIPVLPFCSRKGGHRDLCL